MVHQYTTSLNDNLNRQQLSNKWRIDAEAFLCRDMYPAVHKNVAVNKTAAIATWKLNSWKAAKKCIICSLTDIQRILNKIFSGWQPSQVVSLNHCFTDWLHLHPHSDTSTPPPPSHILYPHKVRACSWTWASGVWIFSPYKTLMMEVESVSKTLTDFTHLCSYHTMQILLHSVTVNAARHIHYLLPLWQPYIWIFLQDNLQSKQWSEQISAYYCKVQW
jgi:hypothetical protein